MKSGIIIKNDLLRNSSWHKRVTHWQESFNLNNIQVEIVASYSKEKKAKKGGTGDFTVLTNSSLPKILSYFLSPFFLAFYVIRKKPDFVLLCNGGFWEYFPLAWLCKTMEKPLLVDMVDTIGRKYKTKKNLIDYLIILNKTLFDKYIVGKSFEIFVISSSLEEYYKKLLPNIRIRRSIPSTVNIERFTESANKPLCLLDKNVYAIFENKNVFKIFYAGTVSRLNGIEFFLSALKRIIPKITIEFVLIFAVIQGNIHDLRKSLSKFGFLDNSIIVPPVTQEYLPILLKKSNLLFIPEQGIETANNGFPGKTSEYLMSGVPVITTSFSDLGYYLSNNLNACITPVGDSNGYECNLKRLMLDHDYRHTIGANGKKLAEKIFSHKDCALPYIQAILLFYSIKGND